MSSPASPTASDLANPAEHSLMLRVKDVCGFWIDEAVQGTPYPAALLAALAANETGGDPTKSRFESAVFGRLGLVLVGKLANYGSIGAQDLSAWITKYKPLTTDPLAILKSGIMNMTMLATSWGPCQIMGYQSLAGHFELSELTSLNTHFKRVVAMLDDFRNRFHLTVPEGPGSVWNPEPYFHCWNSGSPDSKTADPSYTANGMKRMCIYAELA